MIHLREFDPITPEPSRNTGGHLQYQLFAEPSNWTPPRSNITPARRISIDLETCDKKLKTHGPGFKYGEGKVVGIAVSNGREDAYFPFDHLAGGNISRDRAVGWTKDLIAYADEIVMANATYDIGWLWEIGVDVSNKRIFDVQVAEALLDEKMYSYSLNALAKKHLGLEKDESELRKAAQSFEVDPKGDMWKLHSSYVGKYAEADARLTLQVYAAQEPKLHEERLWDLWQIESKITSISAKMTRKGVPVDLEAADELNSRLQKQETELRKQFPFDIWSTDQVGQWIEKQGIAVPRTEKGNLSVTKHFLEQETDPRLHNLKALRDLNRLRKVFIEDGILNGHYRGRVHASFRQTAREDGGTTSGRFACNNPNLQQVPKRSDLGKLIRKLYIAEEGSLWAKADYSSQEPRLQVHYSLLLGFGGAAEARQAFIDGIKLYTFLEKLTGLPYDTCKMLVLGIGYGMGKEKMADTLGIGASECETIRDQFKSKAPFIPELFKYAVHVAESRGFIRTLLGRKARFDFWTPGRDDIPVKTLEAAKQRYPNQILNRADCFKAMNRLIQGSAADQTKLAMVLCDEAGIDLRLPVHDELNSMVDNEPQARLMCEIMENATRLELPSVADLDLGPSWC